MQVPYPTEEQLDASHRYVESMREFENEVLQDKSVGKQTEETKKGFKVTRELFLSDWPEFVVTEATREAAKKNPNITDARLRRGMFRTDEEEEQRRERLRALPLPGDEIEEKPKVMKKIKKFLKMD